MGMRSSNSSYGLKTKTKTTTTTTADDDDDRRPTTTDHHHDRTYTPPALTMGLVAARLALPRIVTLGPGMDG